MNKKRSLNENLVGWCLITPVLILIGVFVLYPSLQNIALSFFKWDGFTPWRFNGVNNYIKMFTSDRLFYQSFINTVIFQIGATTGTVVVGFILAVFIDMRVKLWKAYRVIFFLPYVVAQFAIATLFRSVFFQNGLANEILDKIGLDPILWFGIPWLAKTIMILVCVWQYSSFPMIFFLAGMASIEGEIYEAAEIDGANRFQRVLKITVPMLKSVTSTIVIFQLILSFKVFTYVFIMTTGMPAGKTHVLGTLLYRYAFEMQKLGYSSVIAIVMFVIALIFAFIYLRLSGYRRLFKTNN